MQESIVSDYVPVFLSIGVAIVLGLLLVGLNILIGLKRETAGKVSSYESGIEPHGTEKSRLSVKYFLIAILFIVFDVEVIFLYPWAVGFRDMSLVAGMLPMVTFIAILLVGYVYVIRKKALEWD